MALKIRIFVTHPVQYHVPLWRALASHPQLDVKVFYFSDHSIRGEVDKGFGVKVAWDIDLESGYAHEFLSRNAPLDRPRLVRLEAVDSLLGRERPDWIMFSGYTKTFERQLARAASRHGAQVLMRGEFSELSDGPRSPIKRVVRKAYLHWFYRHVDRFCYPGVMGREHLLKHGVSEDKLFRSPYSVHDELIARHRGGATREAARAALNIPDDRFVFLFSGKLIPRKDPFAILEALRHVPDLSRAGLIVIGDGPLAPDFRREAESLLGDRFVFAGFVNQSEIGKYYGASDALLMPSRQETWGLVVNEAMHAGLPVVVSDQVGCHPDLVLPGRTGFVYPWGNNRRFGEALAQLLDAPAKAREMGAAARERVGSFTIRDSAQGVFEALGVSTAESAAERA